MRPDVKLIAATLTKRRRRLRVPRKTVARRMGRPERVLLSWEFGERVPRLAHLVAWADALGMRITLTESA